MVSTLKLKIFLHRSRHSDPVTSWRGFPVVSMGFPGEHPTALLPVFRCTRSVTMEVVQGDSLRWVVKIGFLGIY